MNDMFYRAFEDRHRGSRELILSRLRVYEPFIEPLKVIDSEHLAFDFGCGRGEWLELIKQKGFRATGVDLDDGMLDSCRKQGLDTAKADLIEFVKTLDSESCVLVSAFHVVEHIAFEQLREFVESALRVLKPGGILIMETPNPDNIRVATRNFYLDPTHQRPIPSELLSFVAEYAGFKRVKTLGLQEVGNLAEKQAIDLRDVFEGASPDYAVVAQKDAGPEVLNEFDEAFAENYGVSLDSLLERHDLRTQRLEEMGASASASISEVEAIAVQAQRVAVEAREQAEEARATNAELVALLGAETARVEALLNSSSWRLTAPLRYVGSAFRVLKDEGARGHIKLMARHGALFVSRRPRLRNAVLKLLNRFPALKSRLRRVVFPPVTMPPASNKVSIANKHLTRRGSEIFNDLKRAVESDNREDG